MEGIVYRCLEKDPAHRFSSMNELVTALKFTAGGISTRDTGENPPMLSGTTGYRASLPSLSVGALASVGRAVPVGAFVSVGRFVPVDALASAGHAGHPSAPRIRRPRRAPSAPPLSTTSDFPGLSTPNSSPPTSSPATYTGPLATDSSLKQPAAPVFRPPVDHRRDGPRPAPPAEGLASTQTGAGPGRKVIPWALAATLGVGVGVTAVLLARAPATN